MTVNRTPSGAPTGGQFAASARAESSIGLTHVDGPPAYDIETTTGDTVKPGDQVRFGQGHDWVEVEAVEPGHHRTMPGILVAQCSNGYLKGMPDGRPLEVVRGDEHGIPALTDTIWSDRMNRGYDSGAPERAEWCDSCSDYQGFSPSNDGGPARELCHGCEDRKIAGYEPPTWGGEASNVNEHGVDMTPGHTPTGGHL